jgi:MerR family regulatory protein
MPRYLTTSQIAQLYGLADSTIRHYKAEGRITPRSKTPGGHARYELSDVVAVLGPPERAGEQEPTITGLTEQSFPPLGQHDIRSSGRAGVLSAEMAALSVREADDSERRSATRPRWGGRLLKPRPRVHA